MATMRGDALKLCPLLLNSPSLPPQFPCPSKTSLVQAGSGGHPHKSLRSGCPTIQVQLPPHPSVGRAQFSQQTLSLQSPSSVNKITGMCPSLSYLILYCNLVFSYLFSSLNWEFLDSCMCGSFIFPLQYPRVLGAWKVFMPL